MARSFALQQRPKIRMQSDFHQLTTVIAFVVWDRKRDREPHRRRRRRSVSPLDGGVQIRGGRTQAIFQVRIPKLGLRLTTPSAPNKVASRHSFNVASTPPHEE